jgi:LysR family positive regulator for ilvC
MLQICQRTFASQAQGGFVARTALRQAIVEKVPETPMNIRELELFKHLATTLHFGRTSLECNITPSGLSRTIQRLEAEIGQPLLLRSNRAVTLTPAGTLFLEYCDDTIGRYQIFRNKLESDTTLRGELSLYCSVTAILSILPQLFAKFRHTYPEVKIRLQTGDAAKALNKLQTGETDIAIAALPDKLPAHIQFIKLLTTPLRFICPRSTPTSLINGQEQINWQKTPIIFPSEGLSRTWTENWFAEKGITPYIYSQVAGNEAIIAMVAMGCGVGVVPQLVLEKSSLRNEVAILPVVPQLKSFTVGACTLTKNQKNPVVQAFWAVIEQEHMQKRG